MITIETTKIVYVDNPLPQQDRYFIVTLGTGEDLLSCYTISVDMFDGISCKYWYDDIEYEILATPETIGM